MNLLALRWRPETVRMTDSNPFDWTAKPESLEAKFKLMCRLPYDPRVRRRHVLVFGFIIDWYHSKYGDALASVRHVHRMVQERDPAGKGLYIGEIHGALADLTAWGYLSQEKGAGRRASRYVPVWAALEPSVQEIPNANDNDRSVLISPNTSVLDSPNATACSVQKSPNKDPSTLTRVLDPGTGMDELDCAAPSAPLSAGLAPADAGTAQEERATVPDDPAKWFDHLYVVYGVRKGKAAARRAFDKIAPDRAAFTSMIEAAGKWRGAAGGIDRKWLSTWLTDECFDEDPSGPRVERPTKVKASPARAKAKPAGPVTATIIAAEVIFPRVGISDLHFTTDDGSEHVIVLESDDADAQYEGQKQLGTLIRAAGLNQIEDSAELLGRTIVIDGDSFAEPIGGQIEPVADTAVKPQPANRTVRPLTPAEQRSCDEAYEAWCAEQDDA
jgi:hypothetical protein